MKNISLKLDERTAEGKKVAKLRESGFIPSIVYGGQTEPLLTQSPYVETVKVVREIGKHTPVDLVINGKTHLAIIKNIDMNSVRHELRHLEFHTINQNDIITTEVPIVITGMGESIAERAGLIILQAIDKIEIKAKPASLPVSLDISILDLATDEDKITVGDIKLPKNVEFADIEQDMSLVIVNVYEPGALQAANEAAGGDALPEDAADVPTEDEEVVSTDEADKAESK